MSRCGSPHGVKRHHPPGPSAHGSEIFRDPSLTRAARLYLRARDARRFALGFGPRLRGALSRASSGCRSGRGGSTSHSSETDTSSSRASLKTVSSVGFAFPLSNWEMRLIVNAAPASSCCEIPAARRAWRTLSPKRRLKVRTSTPSADSKASPSYIPYRERNCLPGRRPSATLVLSDMSASAGGRR